jgi:hypothetical protein
MSDTPNPGAVPAAPVNPPRVRQFTWPETRDTIAVLSTLLFAAAYITPWWVAIPKGTEQYVGQMQGALITQWALIMGWYFGSSKATGEVRAQVAQALSKLPDGGSE